MIITDKRFEDLKVNYEKYLPYLASVHKNFGGPSVYFHQQALKECSQNFLSDRHIEMIYATLSSWGMHRMGETKTKMVEFDKFKSSITSLKQELKSLRPLTIDEFPVMPIELIETLKELCFRLKVSVSKSKIVGNSKALAHILPNLVPPVDRQYTIRFFSESLYNFKDEEEEIFYTHILGRCHEFVRVISTNPKIVIDDRFNTSWPKIFDNLIMVSLKNSA